MFKDKLFQQRGQNCMWQLPLDDDQCRGSLSGRRRLRGSARPYQRF